MFNCSVFYFLNRSCRVKCSGVMYIIEKLKQYCQRTNYPKLHISHIDERRTQKSSNNNNNKPSLALRWCGGGDLWTFLAQFLARIFGNCGMENFTVLSLNVFFCRYTYNVPMCGLHIYNGDAERRHSALSTLFMFRFVCLFVYFSVSYRAKKET